MEATIYVLSDGSRHSDGSFGPDDWYASLDADELQELVDSGRELAVREQTIRWAQGRA